MPWYTPNPQPNQPITSAWGNAIENACYPVFATLTALQTGWTDAPEGAHAFVIGSRSTYVRRGGAWLLPLELVQGIKVNIPGPTETSGNFVPPTGTLGAQVGVFANTTLKGKRTYIVTFQGRFQQNAAANGILSVIVNATGTGKDVSFGGQYNGGNATFTNGQRPIDCTVLLTFMGAVVKQSWTGVMVTGGNDDQDLTVQWQLVLATSNQHTLTSGTQLILVDSGPG